MEPHIIQFFTTAATFLQLARFFYFSTCFFSTERVLQKDVQLLHSTLWSSAFVITSSRPQMVVQSRKC